jgi:hypothetical protein
MAAVQTWFFSKVWGCGAGGHRQCFRGDKRSLGASWEDGTMENGLVGRVSPSKGHRLSAHSPELPGTYYA